ncbi:hypothetical protein [Sinorhizobium meliloti]|uniref:hypothetical protein n=1 Tax=Rhizobium meliloti TaxID=382 RepID=UPI002091046B|nr:hypothetical protein [Sinorhizobium meliloti]MCO5965803.1 hypothetical protein [Sinorhizobium meliloti]
MISHVLNRFFTFENTVEKGEERMCQRDCMKVLSVSNVDPNYIASILLSASNHLALAIPATRLAGSEKSAKGRLPSWR